MYNNEETFITYFSEKHLPCIPETKDKYFIHGRKLKHKHKLTIITLLFTACSMLA